MLELNEMAERNILWTRAQLLEHCVEESCLISLHEHVGSEFVWQRDGSRTSYRQTIPQLGRRLTTLPWERLVEGAKSIAAACIPMPHYPGRKARGENPRSVARLYMARNLRLLRSCRRFFGQRTVDIPRQFIPLPVLIVDGTTGADDFLTRHREVLNSAVALKWHPAAQELSPSAYVEGGHLELASDERLPLIVHCARVGRYGDLDDILETLLPAAEARGVRVHVAHAGFLHPRLGELSRYSNVSTDCCPWSAICSTAEPPIPKEERASRMADVFRQLPGQVALGFDTPWHLQRWGRTELHGATLPTDFHLLAQAIRASGVPPIRVLHDAGKQVLLEE